MSRLGARRQVGGPVVLPLLGFWALNCVLLQPDATPGRFDWMPAGVGAVVVVLVLCAGKRRAISARCKRYGTRPCPLLNASPGMRALLALLFAGTAALGYRPFPALGLASLALVVMLGLERGESQSSAGLRAGAADDLARDLGAWLDATTSRGLCLCGSLYTGGAAWLALGSGGNLWVEALLIATPLWFSGTRRLTSREPRARLSFAAAARRAPDRVA